MLSVVGIVLYFTIDMNENPATFPTTTELFLTTSITIKPVTTTASSVRTTRTTTTLSTTLTTIIKPTLPPKIDFDSYITREQWNGDSQSQSQFFTELSLPIKRIIVTHTAGSNCDYEV